MEINEIEKYIKRLAYDEQKFKESSISIDLQKDSNSHPLLPHLFELTKFLILSSVDFFKLWARITFNRKSLANKRIVYTAKNFCNVVDGKLVDRIVKPLFTDNIIFINDSKETYIKEINDQKVYNLGGVVKFLCFFYRADSKTIRLFKAYQVTNDLLLKKLRNSNVYMMWFYNLNGLSLVFSKFREDFNLVEVQHGSIINYPPYIQPAPVKIADIFYVKNGSTVEYLKEHLCKNQLVDYRLIPYPKIVRKFVPGIHILYASTVEFNGLHPVMKIFLENYRGTDLNLIIRLHPREKEKEPLFAAELNHYNINYIFDHSENWLEGNTIENLIVVSPWSSTLEDAYDNGFKTIIIDPMGKNRYKHLIDNKNCIYSDNLFKTITALSKS